MDRTNRIGGQPPAYPSLGGYEGLPPSTSNHSPAARAFDDLVRGYERAPSSVSAARRISQLPPSRSYPSLDPRTRELHQTLAPATIENRDGSIWKGDLRKGVPWNGSGRFHFKNGSKIQGEWVGGKLEGKSHIVNQDGSSWEGIYQKGKPFHGAGTFINSRGRTETGEWFSGKREGQFEVVEKDGTRWRGTYKNGKPYDGEGSLKSSDGSLTTGRWIRGNLVGTLPRSTNMNADSSLDPFQPTSSRQIDSSSLVEAPSELSDDDLFALLDEELRSGDIRAPQRIEWGNGTSWEGSTKGDRPWTGKGIWRMKGGVAIQGEWQQGKLMGVCTITNPDRSRWKGELHNGRPYTGKGTRKFANGRTEMGSWISGKRVGPFKIIHKNGAEWIGEYVDGKPYSGNGTLILSNGRELTGQWNRGHFQARRSSMGVRPSPAKVKPSLYDDSVSSSLDICTKRQIFHPDGTEWEGICHNDAPWEGKGTWKFTNDISAKGEWKSGILIGTFEVTRKAKIIYEFIAYDKEGNRIKLRRSDGVMLIAHSYHGLPDGLCKIKNPDNTQWNGTYDRGILWTGSGEYWVGLNFKIRGHWLNGELHGECHILNPDKSQWRGIYHDGKPFNGEGTTRVAGVIITGKWVNGKLQGRCDITYPGGEKWEGVYRDSKPYTGNGVYMKGDGTAIRGRWVEGRLVGEYCLRDKDGTISRIQ